MNTLSPTEIGPQPVFRALADPTRREILMRLSLAPMSIGDLADKFDMTRGAVRKHLTILEQGELIACEAVGRSRINRLQPDGLKSAFDWLGYFNAFWDERLRDLKTAIEKEESGNNGNEKRD